MCDVLQLLKNAKDHILSDTDIVSSLPYVHNQKKRWRELRSKLEEGGYQRKCITLQLS